ncbi:hypothetical protein DYH09_17110 [bacterium CPR1]|nr:hypothetical protein [bacterium CPR1]
MNIYTQPNSAITGGSCLQGGNRRRRVEPEETPDPSESVDIGKQVEAVTKQAAQMANATGAQVTLEVGGIKVTVSPSKTAGADPHKPIAQLDEPAAEPQVRSEVKAFLDELKDGEIKGVKHTTRGLPQTKIYRPEAPQPFAAGRFQVDFDTASGEKRAFLVQTESQVGHLHPVTPGVTDIGGHISLLSDPQNSHSETVRLNRDEQDALLSTLYARFDNPMTADGAKVSNFTISTVAAVRFSGEGAAAVSERHRSLT